MTIREKLSRQRRKANVGAVACWLVFGLTAWKAAEAQSTTLPMLVIIAFLGFMAFGLYGLFGLRCSRCQNNLSYATQWPANFWRISEKLQYCPFCGVELSTQLGDLKHG